MKSELKTVSPKALGLKLARVLCCAVTSIACGAMAQSTSPAWATYGGDAGGQRYSSASQINTQNVRSLRIVWQLHTHALDSGRVGSRSAMFESTPILFEGTLYLSTPFDEIIAIDPATGSERWRFEPKLKDLHEGDLITSRGVAVWAKDGAVGACSKRIFIGTNDAHLISVDASSGVACKAFGNDGVVDLTDGLQGHDREFHVTSAPTVVDNVVVVGSSIPDNQLADQAKGTLRAYDVESGKLLWKWEPLPWQERSAQRTGAANAWSTIAADLETGLIFVPTGSASPDYFGGMRPGDDRDADSVVAIDAHTGKKVWAFQVVHHDLWDYDVASEPLLFTWHENTPAVAVTTKMGMVFVLDRRTGKPLYPIEERAVPQSDVPGEVSSPTQPFSSLPSLSPLTFPDKRIPSSAGISEFCLAQIASLRYEGVYTPPSLKGSLVFPGSIGGVNWGSAAYDPTSGNLYANVNRVPYSAQLLPPIKPPSIFMGLLRTIYILRFPVLVLITIALLFLACAWRRMQNRWGILAICIAAFISALSWNSWSDLARKPSLDAITGAFGEDHSPQAGAPYSLYRHPIVDHNGLPCMPGMYGTVSALNLQTGRMTWEQPHGAGRGAPSLGGLIVTAGGLVFSAGTKEPILRAYDSSTGEVLWTGTLPRSAQSTPMTYVVNGKQYVVIAAGGHGLWGTQTGDTLVAFALD